MRILIAVALAAGCKKSEDPPPAPPPRPAVDVCAVGVMALDRVTCSADAGAAISKAKKTFAGFVDAVRKATAGANPQQFQIMCAQMLVALERDTAKAGCKLEIAPFDRVDIKAVLDDYYNERTKVVPTGDPKSDEVVKRAAGIRDQMCDCTDMACLEKVDGKLDTIGALPDNAPTLARDLGGKLIDDIGRCEARIRNAAGL